MHLALAYFYASRMAKPPPWFLEKDLQTALNETGAGFPDGIRNALALVIDYTAYWGDDLWTPVAIEEEISVPLSAIPLDDPSDIAEWAHLEDERVTCRPDLLAEARMPDGSMGIVVVDYKSSGTGWNKSASGLPVWDPNGRYLLDWQVMTNLNIVRAKYGVRNVLGFVVERILQEPVGGHFPCDRKLLEPPAEAYRESKRTMRAAVQRELDHIERAARGRRPTLGLWSCHGSYGKCDYHGLCGARDKAAHAKALLKFVNE